MAYNCPNPFVFVQNRFVLSILFLSSLLLSTLFIAKLSVPGSSSSISISYLSSFTISQANQAAINDLNPYISHGVLPLTVPPLGIPSQEKEASVTPSFSALLPGEDSLEDDEEIAIKDLNPSIFHGGFALTLSPLGVPSLGKEAFDTPSFSALSPGDHLLDDDEGVAINDLNSSISQNVLPLTLPPLGVSSQEKESSVLPTTPLSSGEDSLEEDEEIAIKDLNSSISHNVLPLTLPPLGIPSQEKETSVPPSFSQLSPGDDSLEDDEEEKEAPILPSVLPLLPGDDSLEEDEEDRKEEGNIAILPSPPPSKEIKITVLEPEQSASPHLEGGFARAYAQKGTSAKISDAKKCDLYKGAWVRDEDERYPLYAPGSCPYVDEAFGCQENGRQDDDYLKWRWKPDDCELPRFNARDFLERLRGKRLLLVGDSMNRNQFESLLCILREALQDKSRMFETRGYKITKGRGYYVFIFMDYNCTVSFVRSHFLAREGRERTRAKGQGKSNQVLMIDRVCKSSSRWKKADILIFNTGHWWSHEKTSRGKDYFKEGDVVYSKFDATEAFNKSMQTWGRWIDKNMDPSKSRIFYRGYSTAHYRGGDWDSGGTCNGEIYPASKGPIVDNYPLKMKIIEEVKKKMNFPLSLLNVTKLTNFRKDAHPSIYGRRLIPGQKVSRRGQDCSHWCLPGVPDAWNELLYASLVLEHI